MASRAVGALLGVSAAALIAASLATSAWWAGHPRVDGHTISAKDVQLGLWGGATGCNTGGDEKCSPVPIGSTFSVAALGELGLAGFAALFALVLGISSARDGARKKLVAKLAIGSALIAAAGGGVVFLLGPSIISEKSVDVPIGWGMMMFWGGVAASSLGAIATIATRPEPLRLKTTPPPMMMLQQQPFDVHDMLRDQLGAAPAPGFGDMRIDSEPLGHAPTPAFGSGPGLRAMYDRDGVGIVPSPPKPVLPTRAPTPMPRAAINALVGLPTPPGMAAVEPKTVQSLPPPPGSNLRAESEPIEPPPPVAPPPPPPPTHMQPSFAPPLPPRSPIGRSTPPPMNRTKPPTAAPGPRPSIPLPARGSAPAISPEKRTKPTIAHAIPPPPVAETRTRPETEQDGRLEAGLRQTEPITSVDAQTLEAGRAETPLSEGASSVGDSTDVGVAIESHGPATSAANSAESPTDTPASPPPVITPTRELVPPTPVRTPTPAPAPPPMSTAPTSLPPPKTAQVATTGPTPACPQCESPMVWVEEHLRFYCKQCRMYF